RPEERGLRVGDRAACFLELRQLEIGVDRCCGRPGDLPAKLDFTRGSRLRSCGGSDDPIAWRRLRSVRTDDDQQRDTSEYRHGGVPFNPSHSTSPTPDLKVGPTTTL